MDCLVQKLKANTSNEELEYFNAVKLEVNTGAAKSCTATSTDAYLVSLDCYFDSARTSTKKTIASANTVTYYHLFSDAASGHVLFYYPSLYSGVTTPVTPVDTKFWGKFTASGGNITSSQISGGDIANLGNMVNCPYIKFNNAALFGNIASLGKLTSLGRLDVAKTQCYGIVEELLDAMAENGRVSGSLYVYTEGNLISYNGVSPVNKTFYFTENGWTDVDPNS